SSWKALAMPNSSTSIDLPDDACRAITSPSSLAHFSAADASDWDNAAGSRSEVAGGAAEGVDAVVDMAVGIVGGVSRGFVLGLRLDSGHGKTVLARRRGPAIE